ncbi:N-ethylammeline chlorohydrolase [Candidatus Heimdallarchaeota archaeon]|nr:MAG: N-ethylammeline chlorohydrolase [Candidatus Heimdallarchaeota archaeon]RLI69699.1 MAG: N-ethylammeline chlorohydrolase [Candidatus Gerdarchaeota archaeon]
MALSSLEVDILIFNAHILTINSSFDTIRRGFLLVKDSKIMDIGTMEEFHQKYGKRIDAKEEIDARGDFVLPGFINTHGHFAMTLFRGIADDLPLMKWLEEYIWPIEAKLTKEDCFIGTQLAAIEMIQGGTTTACDMYFFEERNLDALEEIGFRAILGYGMMDFNNDEKREKEITATKKLINYVKNKAKRISVIVSPHAPNTCSQELLLSAKELALRNNLPIQIHLAETREEVAQIKKSYNCTPTEYLDKIGFLSNNVLAAHCVWLTKRDCQLLQKNQVKIAHNPTSNLKLGSGIMNYNLLSKLGITISLGTDGAASNNTLSLLNELQLAAYLHKGINTNPEILPAPKALKMATFDGAIALGLKAEIGSLEIGKKADIIIIDSKAPNMWPPHNPYSSIVYSAHNSNIHTTIIDGHILMRNRRMLTIDPMNVMAKAKQAITRLLDSPELKQFKEKIRFLR